MQQNNNYMIETSSSDDEIIVEIIEKEKRLNNTTNSQDQEEVPIFRPPPKPKYTINPGSGHRMFSSDDDDDDELIDNLKRTRRRSMSLDEVSSSSPYASSPKRFTVSDKDNTNTASLMESRRRSKKTTSGLAEYSPHEQAMHTQSAARQGLLNVLEAVDLPPGINESIVNAVAALDGALSKDTLDYQVHKLQTTTTGGRLLSVAARRMKKTNEHALKPGLGEGENEIEYWFTEDEMQEKWDPRVDGSCLHWRLCSIHAVIINGLQIAKHSADKAFFTKLNKIFHEVPFFEAIDPLVLQAFKEAKEAKCTSKVTKWMKTWWHIKSEIRLLKKKLHFNLWLYSLV